MKIDLTRLSPREKSIAMIVAAMLVILMIDRIVVRQVSEKLKKLFGDTAITETKLRRNLKLLGQKDEILEAAESYPAYMQKEGSDEEEMANLLNELEKLARENSVYLVDVKPLPVDKGKFSKKFSVEINTEAQMDQLVDFLYKVQGSQQLLKIEKANVSPKGEKSSVIKSNFLITKMVIQ